MTIDRQKMASSLQAAINSFPIDDFVNTAKQMSESFCGAASMYGPVY